MAKARYRALEKIPEAEIRWVCSRDLHRAETFIAENLKGEPNLKPRG